MNKGELLLSLCALGLIGFSLLTMWVLLDGPETLKYKIREWKNNQKK